jgi:hypothetical protein
MLLRDPEILRRLSRKNHIFSGLILRLGVEIEDSRLSSSEYEDLAIIFNDLASFAFDQAEITALPKAS